MRLERRTVRQTFVTITNINDVLLTFICNVQNYIAFCLQIETDALTEGTAVLSHPVKNG